MALRSSASFTCPFVNPCVRVRDAVRRLSPVLLWLHQRGSGRTQNCCRPYPRPHWGWIPPVHQGSLTSGKPCLRTGLLSSKQLLGSGPGTPILVPTSRAWFLGQIRGKHSCTCLGAGGSWRAVPRYLWENEMWYSYVWKDLCFPSDHSAPHIILPGSWDPGLRGQRPSPCVSVGVTPTVRNLDPAISHQSVCFLLLDDMCRGFSFLSYCILERIL